jgi:predicted anti-sigma-YlaC factor YlaD
MNHLNEDTLLQWALELLDDEQRRAAEDHIAQCGQCREQWNRVCSDLQAISGLQPAVALSVPVKSRSVRWFQSPLLRAAALILLGVSAAWITAREVLPRHIRVVAAPRECRVPADSLSRLAAPDATEIPHG